MTIGQPLPGPDRGARAPHPASPPPGPSDMKPTVRRQPLRADLDVLKQVLSTLAWNG